MANAFSDIAIIDAPLRIPQAELSASAGAVVDFLGVVREVEQGEKIAGLDYEVHREMAQHQLEKICETARAKFACEKIILHHRVGFVPVGEPSLFVRVTAKHRGPAFAANQWIIEELKKLAPIWKNPIGAIVDVRS